MKNKNNKKNKKTVVLPVLHKDDVSLENIIEILENDMAIWILERKDGMDERKAFYIEEDLVVEFNVIPKTEENPMMLQRIADYEANYENVEMIYKKKIKCAHKVYLDEQNIAREMPVCLEIFIPGNISPEFVKKIL